VHPESERDCARDYLQTEKITKVYDTGEVKLYALAGVDLELFKGELTVLLGQQKVDASEHPRWA